MESWRWFSRYQWTHTRQTEVKVCDKNKKVSYAFSQFLLSTCDNLLHVVPRITGSRVQHHIILKNKKSSVGWRFAYLSVAFEISVKFCVSFRPRPFSIYPLTLSKRRDEAVSSRPVFKNSVKNRRTVHRRTNVVQVSFHFTRTGTIIITICEYVN